MSRPCVSIIMGSHNPANPQQLFDAVRSIQCQTWPHWELLLCDDGSNRTYAAYLREAAAMDHRIRYICCDRNLGLAHALNLCLKHANGSLIARMDDDDISEPERLQKQVQFLLDHPAYAWVGCQAWLFDETGIWGEGSRPEIPQPRDFLKYSPYIHPSVMFRREVLEEAGGYLVSPLTMRCEDYELFMRLTAAGFQGCNLQENLFCYRESATCLKKRSLQNCLCEIVIRWQGFRKLKILSLKTLPYLCKPLAVYAALHFPHFSQKLRLCRATDNHVLSHPEKGEVNHESSNIF